MCHHKVDSFRVVVTSRRPWMFTHPDIRWNALIPRVLGGLTGFLDHRWVGRTSATQIARTWVFCVYGRLDDRFEQQFGGPMLA